MLAKDVFRGIMQWQTLQVVVEGEYSSHSSQISIRDLAMCPGAIEGFSASLLAVFANESFQDNLQH